MPANILLADDHGVLREGLRALLERAEMTVIAEASDGREAVKLACQLKPSVAVLDLTMPQLNGMDATRELLRGSPKTRVVILTMHSDDAFVMEALRAGARAYVLKAQAATDLVRAIQEVMNGRFYLCPGISSTVVQAYLSGLPLPPDPLTPREREVLQLIAEGHSNKEIANALFVSVKTAETHRLRIMGKLDIHHTAGLVLYAIRRGLIQG